MGLVGNGSQNGAESRFCALFNVFRVCDGLLSTHTTLGYKNFGLEDRLDTAGGVRVGGAAPN
jgi:hypothetical protein